MVKFYQQLFTSSEPKNFEEILEQIPTMVTDDMNKELLNKFIAEEVKDTLKQMTPLKSPGPDGMPSLFYQSYWFLVGADVTKAILLYLNSGLSQVHFVIPLFL